MQMHAFVLGRGAASRPPEITILNTALRWAVRESESERFYSGPRSNLLNLRALRSCDPSNFRTFFLVITELLRSSKSNYRSIELSVHIRKDTSKMRHAPVFGRNKKGDNGLYFCICSVLVCQQNLCFVSFSRNNHAPLRHSLKISFKVHVA